MSLEYLFFLNLQNLLTELCRNKVSTVVDNIHALQKFLNNEKPSSESDDE